MKNKVRSFPLKVKLTIMSVIVLTVMCICLTIIAMYSANLLTEAISTTSTSGIVSESLKTNEQIPDYSIQTDKVATKNYRTTIIFSMITFISLGSVLTYFFASKTLKPLEEFTETVNNININNLNENITVPKANDEVKRLTESFNDMTTKLHLSYQMQKNFSANAAHELRTPLTVMQTQIEVAQMKSDMSNAEYTSLLQQIGENTERLSSLVNDLLSFTNEQVVNMSQKVNLRELIDETVFELEEKSILKNISVTVSGEGEIYGDDSLLQRAFYNLISNAIRYNVDNGKVIVEISDKYVTISDTGVGIPDHAKPNIFNLFFCVDKSRSHELGGSGLGLAIVKNIIERHNGAIYVKDNKPSGSIFVVCFDKENLYEIYAD